jgi:hypothetical protein
VDLAVDVHIGQRNAAHHDIAEPHLPEAGVAKIHLVEGGAPQVLGLEVRHGGTLTRITVAVVIGHQPGTALSVPRR